MPCADIDSDDELMAAALDATGLQTQREAAELGLRTPVCLKQQGDIRPRLQR